MILPLRLEDVAFSVKGRALIHGVTLELAAGPSSIILGANGAGKSVLMRLMHGLLAPSAGRVAWSGDHARRGQAMVFQRPVMLRRSALANVMYALALAGVPRAEREAQAREALDSVGLLSFAQRPARVLSGGEQQRLALARALLARPDWLFLDESTSAVEEKLEAELYAVLARRLPDTTVVSIGHRSSVIALHRRHIEMAPHGERFTLRDAAKAAAAE
jgi:tungstate transport system ATP-binding protein